MLGAQALRTKQRVEEKERQRQKERRQQKAEAQRASIQSAANEDAQAAMLEFAAAQQAAMSNGHHNFHSSHHKPHQRHSLHTTVLNDHIVPLSAREGSQLEITHHRLPPRSPSTDYGKESESSGGGNRLFRWLGLSSNNHKKQAKRRMSTY